MAVTRPNRAHDAELARLLDAASDGLVCFDESGVVIYANAAARELLSQDEDPLGKTSDELGAPAIHDLVSHCLKPHARCKSHPQTVHVGERALAVRSWRARSKPRTIALSLRNESDLIGKRERVQAVLNATLDGLLVLTPADEITYANPAALSMLHATEAQLIHQRIPVDALLGIAEEPHADPPRTCHEVLKCENAKCPAYNAENTRCWLMSGTLCTGPGAPKSFAEKRADCLGCEVRDVLRETFDPLCEDFQEIDIERDEHRLVVKVKVTPIVDAEGDYIGRVVSLRDITPEREIIQMKNEFVSTVSHELRTPLTSIKGYVDLILDGDAGEINEVQREFLSIVQENSDRLVELINDMLDISRMESGRIHLHIEPQSVLDLIEGAVDTFRAVLSQSGRQVEVRAAESLPDVAADRDRVRQVLINLVSNAIKYSPEGGDIRVTAESSGGYVRVSVRDSGLGISREDQRLLFNKFYRVDSAITRQIGGTGLGLSICKSIIELLGGQIGVRSTPGKGSTFWFTLPVVSGDIVRTPQIEGPEQAGATVLVIDSDPEIASLVETYLVKRGYSVLKAQTAEEAFALAVHQRPSVITLDVILRNGDGFALLQQLKEHPETSAIPVVVLSIVCDEGLSCRFGAADYLEKPIDKNRLIEMVGQLIGTAESPLALVVDDDRAIVGVLTETLKRRGFSVASAYDGAEALASIERRIPDIMLLDLHMPNIDGYEVIRRVKTNDVWAEIPIVVMTGHPIDSAHGHLLAHAAGRVSKPLSGEGIAAKVEELLSGVPVHKEAS